MWRKSEIIGGEKKENRRRHGAEKAARGMA